MNLQDRVLFSAIMALTEENEEAKEKASNDSNSSDNHKYTTPSISADTTHIIERLCNIAQGLFNGADMNYTSSNELVPSMICGIIFETINVLDIKNETKKEMYRTASEFCGVVDVLPEKFLFSDVELSQTLMILTNNGFELIVTAAEESDNNAAVVGFIKVFSELMLYLESTLLEDYPHIPLKERPALLVTEKIKSIIKRKLHQVEEENPELKNPPHQKVEDCDTKNIDNLLNNARNERKKENMKQAEEYYRRVNEIQPDNWEAYFFYVFCSVYCTSDNVNPSLIQNYTKQIIDCIPETMVLAKKQLYSHKEIVIGISEVAVSVSNIACNYFIAAMNRYKSAGKSTISSNAKNAQVNAVIQMLFTIGDSIESNFSDTPELCSNIACKCWIQAFTCYESCNMPAPQELSDHYYKIRKYIPDFRCEKPLSGGYSSSSHSSEGCYIATAVYGSYDCPPVWTLRRFRDLFLAKSWYGRMFIRFYYAVSPQLVEKFRDTKWFIKMCKYPLDKLVWHLIKKGYDSTEYTDGCHEINWRKCNGHNTVAQYDSTEN